MADIREELDNALISEWEHHPVTAWMARNVSDELKKAEINFLAYARASTDPQVRAAIARLDELHKTYDMLVLGKEQK